MVWYSCLAKRLPRMKPFIPQGLPIPGLDLTRLMPAIGEANRSLARYDGLVQKTPAPTALLVPLLARREALDSSRIEGFQTTLSDVFHFEESENFAKTNAQRDDLREILNHASAAHLAEAELENRSFTLNLMKTLHARLLNSGRGQRNNPGQFRTIQNWIGREGTPMEQASFVPPEPLRVPEYMEQWERYYHSGQPDILMQAAILHAQFELVHPFMDGNGRLGRLMIPVFLREKKVLSCLNFYPSAYLDEHRAAYMDCLRGLGANNAEEWHRWITFFLEALTTQARRDSETVVKMTELYEGSRKRFLDLTQSRLAIPLLDAIFNKPLFRTAYLNNRLAALEKPPTPPTLSSLLAKLTKGGVLMMREPHKGRRGALYEFSGLMGLLEG